MVYLVHRFSVCVSECVGECECGCIEMEIEQREKVAEKETE